MDSWIGISLLCVRCVLKALAILLSATATTIAWDALSPLLKQAQPENVGGSAAVLLPLVLCCHADDITNGELVSIAYKGKLASPTPGRIPGIIQPFSPMGTSCGQVITHQSNT